MSSIGTGVSPRARRAVAGGGSSTRQARRHYASETPPRHAPRPAVRSIDVDVLAGRPDLPDRVCSQGSGHERVRAGLHGVRGAMRTRPRLVRIQARRAATRPGPARAHSPARTRSRPGTLTTQIDGHRDQVCRWRGPRRGEVASLKDDGRGNAQAYLPPRPARRPRRLRRDGRRAQRDEPRPVGGQGLPRLLRRSDLGAGAGEQAVGVHASAHDVLVVAAVRHLRAHRQLRRGGSAAVRHRPVRPVLRERAPSCANTHPCRWKSAR